MASNVNFSSEYTVGASDRLAYTSVTAVALPTMLHSLPPSADICLVDPMLRHLLTALHVCCTLHSPSPDCSHETLVLRSFDLCGCSDVCCRSSIAVASVLHAYASTDECIPFRCSLHVMTVNAVFLQCELIVHCVGCVVVCVPQPI